MLLIKLITCDVAVVEELLYAGSALHVPTFHTINNHVTLAETDFLAVLN